jgi:hypothetical protein
MAKLTAIAKSPVQRVLVYGPPKTGKTELTSKLAHQFKILYFGLENGHSVFYKLPPEIQENVEIVNLPDTRGYPIAIETMLKVIKGGKTNICDTHGKVECSICKAAAIKDPASATFTTVELNALDKSWIVIVDSLTQLTNSAIAHITKGQPEDYKMQHDDWGNLGKLMDTFLSYVQQAQYNIICISHETETELEDGKVKIVPTAGTRNFSRNSAKYFDHVVYAQVSNMKHTFTSMTTHTVNIVVGSRTDVDLKTTGSLLPIFTGEIKSVALPSPGAIAASGLQGLLKKP